MINPEIVWWDKAQATAIDEVRDLAAGDPLVTSFGDGLVVVAMGIGPDGGYTMSWTVKADKAWSLSQIELFIAKVATYLIDEPIE